MILEVVKYGHPALRAKGERITRVTREIKRLIADMFETMYDARGIGLAAQQVGRALQLTVIDVRGITDRPSSLEVDGKSAAVDSLMPLVLMNPEVKPASPPEKGTEGCLSFPEIFTEIERPGSVDVRAMDADGNPFGFRCGGLLARVIQHETDHLNGILFIDRMDIAKKREFKPELEELQATTKATLQDSPNR